MQLAFCHTYRYYFINYLQILNLKGSKRTIIIFIRPGKRVQKRKGGGANPVSSSIPPKKCTMSTIGFKNIMVKYSLCLGLLWIPRSHITCLYRPHMLILSIKVVIGSVKPTRPHLALLWAWLCIGCTLDSSYGIGTTGPISLAFIGPIRSIKA